jgi:oligo-1,6-glucosidase
MRFWLDKGVDGFRMDAFQFVSKDTTWPVLPEGYDKTIIKYYGMGPNLHNYLQEMNREVISKYDVMTVAEGAGSTLEDAHALVDPDRNELNMAYHFEAMDVGNDPKGYKLTDLKRVFSKWDSAFTEKGWVALFLANHDVPRMVSKFGNDSPPFREASSKMLTTFILGMRGTPYCYNGDEIGMTNIRFDRIEDYRDVAAINGFRQVKNKGGDTAAFLEKQKFIGRDNARTPFQWDASANAGFTTGTPWLKVNPNYKTINAAAQEKDPKSVLNYFREMTKLRKDLPELVYGDYQLLDPHNETVYAYTRNFEGKKVLVLLNFSETASQFILPAATGKPGTVLINNRGALTQKNSAGGSRFTLQPYQSVIVRIH